MDAPLFVARGLLALAALVLVPLAVSFARRPHRNGESEAGLDPRALLLAALALGVALTVRNRALAVLLSTPWLVTSAWLAIWGLRRLVTRARPRLEELAIDVGLAYLPVGAAWAVAYQADLVVLGFSGMQALLTALHFHVAGLGACTLAGLVGRSLPERGVRRAAWRIATVVIVTGMLALAIGISYFRPLERVMAVVLALAMAVLGVLLVSSRSPLLVVAGFAGIWGMYRAASFALIGFGGLDASWLRRMLLEHGVVNAVGFVGCGLLGFRLRGSSSRATPAGIPFSAIRARGRVGARFFEEAALMDASRQKTGLTDAFAELSRAEFDASACAPEVRAFYEHTAEHWLVVRAEWSPLFRAAGVLWHALARRFGQLALPIADRSEVEDVTSRIVALHDEKDGRHDVRAWIRTRRAADGGEGEVIYVAAYSSHARDGVRYMNIAFPLPYSNMTSVLHLDPIEGGGVRLSTRGRASGLDGDEGVWLSTALGAARLPLDETIEVWPAKSDDGWCERLSCPNPVDPTTVSVLARHDMWLCGVRYVRLTYFIGAKP